MRPKSAVSGQKRLLLLGTIEMSRIEGRRNVRESGVIVGIELALDESNVRNSSSDWIFSLDCGS
jgi:hypothetical protein